MKIEPIGRRVAGYRKAAGFKTADDLARAISNPAITKATIQNVESGRKADLSVSQLLDISRAIGVPPYALVVPINLPFERASIPGVGPEVAAMTNWEVVRWFMGMEPPTSQLGSWMAAVVRNIEDLRKSVEDYPAALKATNTTEEIVEFEDEHLDGTPYTSRYDPNEANDYHFSHVIQQGENAYRNLKQLTKSMDLSWAKGPWENMTPDSDG